MSEQKHTQGKAEIRFDYNVFIEGRLIANCGGHCRNTSPDNCHAENSANAQLVQEAFNVAHETGLTPAQLRDKVTELECGLKSSTCIIDELDLQQIGEVLELPVGTYLPSRILPELRVMKEQMDALLSAAKAMKENIDRWLETGTPASAEESKALYDGLCVAIEKAEGKDR